jgi:hypothetical protein
MIKPNLIALVNTQDKLIKPSENYNRKEPEISVSIARLEIHENGSKTPLNYSHKYDESESVSGGQFARIFASYSTYENKTKGLFGYYGPSISWGGRHDYERAAKGLSKVEKRLEKIYQDRGNAIDPADEMGRWLEAAGIEEVWSRPTHENGEWLNKGEWKQESIGHFINRVRTLLPDN